MSAGSHSAGSSSAGSHWPSVMGQNNTDVSKGLPEDVINNLKGICKDFDIATKGGDYDDDDDDEDDDDD